MEKTFDYLEKIDRFHKDVKDTVESDMTTAYAFQDVASFPNEKGLYFIYYKDVVIYIGCSYDGDSTIRKRCKQQKDRPDELQLRIERVFTVESDEARRIIDKELSVKFIELGEDAEAMIYNYEGYCIAAFSPVLNLYRNDKSQATVKGK